MKFKTNIQLVTEAENKTEAIDIVDEYLSGNITSGIDMKCTTKRVRDYGKGVIVGLAVVFLVCAGAFSLICTQHQQGLVATGSVYNAVQPPLKTSESDKKRSDFKTEWQKQQLKEALGHIGE